MLVPPRYSLVSNVAHSLRTAIETGEICEFLPNVRVLSRELSVSIPTILAAVRILTDEGLVEVRQGYPTKILSSVRPAHARAEAAQRVVFLGFSAENIETSGYFREVAEQLRKLGCVVELHQFVKKVPGLKARDLERFSAGERVGCWVLIGAPPRVQEMFADRKLPCLIGGGVAGQGLSIPDFEVDYCAVYRHAAHQLLNLGHQRIHLLIEERSANKNPASLEAFVSAVRERHPDQNHRSLIKTHDGSTSQIKSLLDSLFAPHEKPTALFVALVSHLVLAQSWLMGRGYRIPQDVSLICRDCDEVIQYLDPLPAHYSHSEKQSSRLLVRTISSVLNKLPTKKHTLVMPEFVKGESLARTKTGVPRG